MWDAHVDLGVASKDIPCNTHAYFLINNGRLDMTVCNRSNDIVWGCYGANAVHFSILQEYMAALIGVPVGRYWQISNNWHLYLNQHKELMGELSRRALMPPSTASCPYSSLAVKPFPMFSSNMEAWHTDLGMFLEGDPAMGYKTQFFRRVALPMHQAWLLFKSDPGPGAAIEAMDFLSKNCLATDWQLAGMEWLNRRAHKRANKETA